MKAKMNHKVHEVHKVSQKNNDFNFVYFANFMVEKV